MSEHTICDQKKNLFALLHMLYEEGIVGVKMGGFGDIIEVDEALLGKKPTYGHGHISKLFKI